MRHADERLLTRATPKDADNAYTLLRNRNRLVLALAAAAARDPVLAVGDRVALPLRQGKEPPHLIVARDGGAVTCLASGMFVGLPTLPWPDVAAHLAHEARLLAAHRAAALMRDEDVADTAAHALEYGHRMTRDDFEVLRSVAIIMDRELVDCVAVTTDYLGLIQKHQTRSASARVPDRKVEPFWMTYATTCQLLMASAGHEVALRVGLHSGSMKDVLLSVRGIWLLVNYPERTLALLDNAVEKNSRARCVGGILPLLIIGFRFDWLKARATALLAACQRVANVEADAKLMMDALREDLLVRHLLLFAPTYVDRLPSAPDSYPDDARKIRLQGLDVDAVVAQLCPHVGALVDGWNPLLNLHQPPRPEPRPPRALTSADERSIGIWRQAVLHSVFPMGLQYLALTAAFSCLPVEALIPSAEPDPHWSMAAGRKYLNNQLPQILSESIPQKPEPLVNKAAVGPNQPCPCGSGKKAKKCCLAVA